VTAIREVSDLPRHASGPEETVTDREARLLAQGWTRRFVGGPPRLRETVELYKSLGYEVLLEVQAPEELREECQGCAVALGLYKVVYTRRSKGGGS
jgi:hypothetical protein